MWAGILTIAVKIALPLIEHFIKLRAKKESDLKAFYAFLEEMDKRGIIEARDRYQNSEKALKRLRERLDERRSSP